MSQLFLLSVSFVYGLICGLLYYGLDKMIKKKKAAFYLIILAYFIIITLGYVLVFFILNSGAIHLYLKLVLIIGFILSYKLSNYRKIEYFGNKK